MWLLLRGECIKGVSQGVGETSAESKEIEIKGPKTVRIKSIGGLVAVQVQDTFIELGVEKFEDAVYNCESQNDPTHPSPSHR